MSSGVVMSFGPWYGSSLDAKEARIAKPLNTYRDANQVSEVTGLYCKRDRTPPLSVPVGSVLPDAEVARCGDPESPALTESPVQFLSHSEWKKKHRSVF